MKKPSKKQRIELALATLNSFHRTVVIIKLFGWLIQSYVKKIPNYIITPDGIMYDRRKANQFVFPEKRLSRILRAKLIAWLISWDDKSSLTS